MPYFEPAERSRRRELELCLEKNRSNPALHHIYLMVDDDAEVSVDDGRVTVIRMDRRPTYQDWTRLTEAFCPNHISILANADIYFDETVSKLERVFEADPTGFVALSRYELEGEKVYLHPNPHWSQDTWAYSPAHASNPDRDRCLNFPLGVPRCDNKVAYTFAVYGHQIYNPCGDVRSIHVHETGIRTYDKKGDMRIVGGMAMVHASESLTAPAPLELEMWPVNTEAFSEVAINKSLERWAREREMTYPQIQSPKPVRDSDPLAVFAQSAFTSVETSADQAVEESGLYVEQNVVGYDAHWQHPAITEQHAFNQVRLLALRGTKTAYLGFPWATLIDVSNHNKSDLDRLSELRDGLAQAIQALKGYDRVVTTCQHIHMLKFPELFADAGVTDVFWSHSTHDQLRFGAEREIKIHPFPLYPVQVPASANLSTMDRKYLFSFVGARASDIYLTQSRTYLIEELAADQRGYVRDRETWHYNKIVYDQQVLQKTSETQNLVDSQASLEFRDIMAQTQFALCPSGTGPNSIRLWEAIASGAIPVVLADTYKAPGSQFIWNEAVVTCGEDRESIRALPERLEALLADEESLERRKVALKMLSTRYGRSNFVPDVLSFLAS